MTGSDFLNCNQMRGMPAEDSARDRLRDLAAQYVRETEAYDDGICTGRAPNGESRPGTCEQIKLCSQNALAIRARPMPEVFSLGFSNQDWQDAVRKARDRVRP